MKERYKNLNDEQKKAVDHIDGPCLVLAGAGTGKTETISLRIANLIKKGHCLPSEILCLTFTKSGKIAMQNRLIEILGESAYYVEIHTFHSFCYDIISKNKEIFSDFKESEIDGDGLESAVLLKQIFDDLPGNSALRPFGDDMYFFYDVQSKISSLKQEGITPDKFDKIRKNFYNEFNSCKNLLEEFTSMNARKKEFDDNFVDNFLEVLGVQGPTIQNISKGFFKTAINKMSNRKKANTEFKKKLNLWVKKKIKNEKKIKEFTFIYSEYQKRGTDKGIYDFGDLIVQVLDKFDNNKLFLKDIQESFRFLLVDEFQDSSGAQNKIIYKIAENDDEKNNPNIFAVGDDDQSIYRFQGAKLENIYEFRNKYKNINEINLIKNYRSGQTILDSAENVIKNNQQRIKNDGRLIASLEKSTNRIQFYQASTNEAKIYLLSEKIKELVSNGAKYSNIAILCRKNQKIRDIANILLKQNIPYSFAKGENILKFIEIEKIIDIFKFIVNQKKGNLFKILNMDFFGFDILDIQGLYNGRDCKNLDILKKIKYNEKFKSFYDKLHILIKASRNETLVKFFEIFMQNGFLEYYENKKPKFLNAIYTLFLSIKEFYVQKTKTKESINLKAYCKYLDLLDLFSKEIKEKKAEASENSVKLMTVHGAKGLEFDNIFIVDLSSKVWETSRNMEKISFPDGILKNSNKSEKTEDERRLFYVALTRAKKNCFLITAELNDRENKLIKSMFLCEIGDENLETKETSFYENTKKINAIFLKKEKKFDIDENAKNKLRNFVLSFSSLESYLKCHKKFYYERILRVPMADNKNLLMGNCVHFALEEYVKKFKKKSIPPSDDFLMKKIIEVLEKSNLKKDEKNLIYKEIKSFLPEYVEQRKGDFASCFEAEYNFNKEKINILGINITGKLDRMDLLLPSKKDICIVDYKTGNPNSIRNKNSLKKGGNFHRQIAFYKLLCDNSTLFNWNFVYGEIDFVRTNEDGKFKKTQIYIDNDDILKLENDIKFFKSEAVEKLCFDKTDDKNECKNCNFYDFCFE